MGRDKAFIDIEGRPMVRHAWDALRDAGATSVRCIGGDAPRLEALGLVVQPDDHPGEGPLGALLTALGPSEPSQGRPCAAEDAVLVVLTCDLPFVDASVIGPLLDALARHREAAGAAPLLAGEMQYLTAAYRPNLVRPTVERAFQEGRRAVRAGLAELFVVAVDGIEARRLTDADTPAELPTAARCDRSDPPSSP